jgi:hypothetical protein
VKWQIRYAARKKKGAHPTRKRKNAGENEPGWLPRYALVERSLPLIEMMIAGPNP